MLWNLVSLVTSNHGPKLRAPTVNYNRTLNSKSECYVRITKEHLRCMLLSSNAPRCLWPFALQYFCRIFGWWSKSNGIAPWKRVGLECQLTADLDRDPSLHAFSSYCIGHLPRESKLVENTTLDDRGLEGAFLMSATARQPSGCGVSNSTNP